MMMVQSLSAQPTLHELLDGIIAIDAPGVLANIRPSGLCLDSRQLQPGQVFFALHGSRTDGSRYISDAIHASASAVISATPVDAGVRRMAAERRVPVLVDAQLQYQLGRIASRFYGHPSRAMQVIAITGTDGKTSQSHFIAQALDHAAAGRRCAVIGTLGYGFRDELAEASHTTPDAIRMQKLLAGFRDSGAAFVSMEASSHALDQGRIDGTAVAVAVLTNLGRDHMDYHGDVEHYKAAKARLFHMHELNALVLNAHDTFSEELLENIDGNIPVSVYGLGAAPSLQRRVDDWVIGHHLLPGVDGLQMRVQVPDDEFPVHCRLIGEFNAWNVLATIAVLRRLGLRQDAALRSVDGRMQFSRGETGAAVVIDYAHTPQALQAALTALRRHCSGRLWCVFGCGGDRDRGKRALMGGIAEKYADRIIVTDDNPRFESAQRIAEDIMQGVNEKSAVTLIHDRREAIACALREAAQDDLILIAGKGHERVQQIAGENLPFNDQAVVDSLRGGLQ